MSVSKACSHPRVSGARLIDEVSSVIRAVAAEVIVPRFRMLAHNDIEIKKGGSLVTVADKESETLLSRKLSALLPGSAVLGEESYEINPAVIDCLTESEWVWIIDPLDGTRNFTNGSPIFGVIVGLAQNNRTEYSWLYDVLGDAMITAQRGEGAWLEEGAGAEKRRLGVRAVDDLDDMTAQVGGHIEHRYTNPLEAAGVDLSRIRCAMHDFIRFSDGFAQMVLHNQTKPWDHAPTVLVAQEAGGYVALADGRPYKPSDFGEMLLAATDKESWERLAHLIFAQA